MSAWSRTTIGAVATVTGGLTKNGKRAGFPVKRPYLTVANVYANQLALTDVGTIGLQPPELGRVELRAGDLLVVEGNGSISQLGRVAVWNDEVPGCVHQNHLIKVRPSDRVSSKWLLYWLLSPEGRDAIEAVGSSTSGLHTLSISKIEGLPVAVCSLPQQAGIVAAIETQFTRLDAAVATLERVKANLKRARASVLKAAVEGRLVPTEAALARAEGRPYEPASVLLERILDEHKTQWSKGKKSEPVAPETGELPDLPEGWVWASVDQLVERNRPICYGVLKAGDHHEGGVPVVRVTDITAKDLSLPRLKRCDPVREAMFARARLRGGDLVVSKDGTIGQVMVVPVWLDGANVTQHVLRVSPNGAVLNRFLMHALHSTRMQRTMKMETRGVALQGINVEDFRRLATPVPPLAEQLRIVAEVERRLSLLDKLDATVDLNLARCRRLRQSILKRAFEGRLVAAHAEVTA